MKKTLLLRVILGGAIAAQLAGVTAAFAAPASAPGSGSIASNPPLVTNLPDFTQLVDRVGPAVVNIRTTERVSRSQRGLPPGMDDDMAELFRRFFGVPMPQPGPKGGAPKRGQPQPDEEQNSGVGSGFIMSSDGYILTNAHVVDGADSIYVTLTDKREFKAKLVGADKRTDVAVVKVEAKDLPTVPVGDSNKLRVGEWVVAIGSPFGLENTVTAGIVSAKGRDTGDYLPFIQTDVAVNPGNSGGPLINMRGEVVGINSMIYSQTGGFMGISFAIPIDEVMRVVDQLKKTGKVVRGRIGVAISEVSKDVADSLGLPRAQGALVRSIEPGSPAEKAGVQPGDIIMKFEGRPVDHATDLPRMVGETKPGSTATLQVLRKGKNQDLRITIAEADVDTPKASKAQGGSADTPHPNALGLVVSDLTDAQKKDLKLRGGVAVELAEGPAGRAGLQQGDIILRVGDADITSAKQFEEVVKALDPKRLVPILVRRGDATQFVPLRPRAQGK
ncbi:DegQ family serine endoprotease [Pandoraea pnomenusa]|uniref:DegQ family serine endoprotease n=1 Tax=Pandoraea pnomenusa TaxID=93220 RepID=UPI00242FBD74|nr:DegQ family serine endoprotease [Pandoraea pnomenusa]